MDEVIAKAITPKMDNTQFEIMVPVENTGVFDEKGNPISGFRKETVNIDQLQRQKENLQTQIDAINAKLEAINNVKE